MVQIANGPHERMSRGPLSGEPENLIVISRSEQMRHVLLTGAEGLIGGILRERLADRYHFRYLTRSRKRYSDVVGDVADMATLTKAVQGVDSIVHLAGAASVNSSWETVLASNIVGTRNILEAAKEAHVRQVILASSNHVVGGHEADIAPAVYEAGMRPGLSVDAPPRPDSLYGVSKLFGEAMGRYYVDQYGIHVVCLRIGSVRSDDGPFAESGLSIEPWSTFDSLTRRRRQAAAWLSHRDCASLIAAAIDATDVPWCVVYGVSDNAGRFWDLEPGASLLGWRPADGAPVPA
jgi:NAD+ dependent glucose-6-phosphate dehydrogenase